MMFHAVRLGLLDARVARSNQRRQLVLVLPGDKAVARGKVGKPVATEPPDLPVTGHNSKKVNVVKPGGVGRKAEETRWA